MRKEVKALIKRLERQGFDCADRTGNGHPIVRTTTGEFVTTLPSSPGDRRWRDNAIGQLRRAGYNPNR